jgi:hypothetical protein
MTRLMKKHLRLLLVLGLIPGAFGFSLLGPYKTWEVTPLGYNLPGDIGGPMTLIEGYRWNVPVIHYAFDRAFITYFGSNGMAAVDAAMKVFSDLPRMSQITNDGSSIYINGEPVPTDSKGPPNFGLNVAGLLDLKSHAMHVVLEELGLAEPERYIWTIRGRRVDTFAGVMFTNYTVIKLNYDPVTLQQSSFVNGTVFDYEIFDPIPNINYADAIETIGGSPAPYAYSSVAAYSIGPGEYYFGLTHDDVGGLRALYTANNLAVEQLLPGITGGPTRGISGSPWRPFAGITNTALLTNGIVLTNNAGTNLLIQGLRPGINKLTFKRSNYDSLLGQFFKPITNTYTDMVISNNRPVLQSVQRVITQPDIVFTVGDAGLVLNLVPNLYLRTVADGVWQNNGPINGAAPLGGVPRGGPGVIPPQVTIMFSDQLPYILNFSPDFLTGPGGFSDSGVWGSFDENTEIPIIYPAFLNLTLQDLKRRALLRGP